MQVVYLLQCCDDSGSYSNYTSTLGVFTSVLAAKSAAKYFDEDLVWDAYNRASILGLDAHYAIVPAVLQDEEDAHDQIRVWRIKDIAYYEHQDSVHSYADHLVSTVNRMDSRGPRRGSGRRRLSE